MHVTTKDVIGDKKTADEIKVPVGTHIITSTVDGDGAVQLVSPDAKLHGEVISIARTPSGGFIVQTAVFIDEPQPVAAPTPEPPIIPLTPEEEAAEYLAEKGLSETDAEAAVAKFGAQSILLKKQAELKDQLNDLLAPKPKQLQKPTEDGKPN